MSTPKQHLHGLARCARGGDGMGLHGMGRLWATPSPCIHVAYVLGPAAAGGLLACWPAAV
nr:MAG TPA_asm: hypothetical protein [Caudoviricetes sp.]